MATQFISSYRGVADYGVYVRRLGYDIRVHHNQETGELTCTSSSITPDERADCIQAVEEFLASC